MKYSQSSSPTHYGWEWVRRRRSAGESNRKQISRHALRNDATSAHQLSRQGIETMKEDVLMYYVHIDANFLLASSTYEVLSNIY
jgi:hypothetical protein